MPAIPDSTRRAIDVRLAMYARHYWPQLQELSTRHRGTIAWLTGVLPDGSHLPLCRLRYGGSTHSFGFAIYTNSSGRFEDTLLVTGSPVGTPQEALDTACTVHLAGPGRLTPNELPNPTT